MNLLVPSAPSGPHGTPGAGEGAHSRRNIADGEFAAALAETAGDVAEGVAGDKPRTHKHEPAGGLSRAVQVFEARGARGRQNREVPTPRADVPAEVVAEPKSKSARRSEAKAPVRAVEPVEIPEMPPAAPGSEPTVNAAAAAREALAALGAEPAARPDRAASPELAETARKASALRGPDVGAPRTKKVEGADAGAEPMLGEEAQTEVIPVRVVRQEKHFQPGGAEARHWQLALDVFEEGRAMATPAPVAGKPVETEVQQRGRPAAPMAPARAPEAATPVTPSVPSTGELAPGTVGFQIADRVQLALSTPAEPAAPTSPAAASPELETRQTFAPALRTMKLQLNPAELGAVTIVLSGSDEGLRIELAAELADTVSKVESDRGVLVARLSGAGYTVTEVTVARFAGGGLESDTRDPGARQGGAQEQLAGNTPREGGAQFSGQNPGRRFGTSQPHADTGAGPLPGGAAAPVVAGVSYAGRFRPV
jgi:flagellar hook-length control protein FliK